MMKVFMNINDNLDIGQIHLEEKEEIEVFKEALIMYMERLDDARHKRELSVTEDNLLMKASEMFAILNGQYKLTTDS